MLGDLPDIDPDEIVSRELTTADLVVAALILLAAIVTAWMARRALTRLGERELADPRVARAIGRFASVVILLIGLFTAMSVLDVRLTPLLGALGVGSIVVAIALREVLENFAAGILLQLRRPMRLGDQVLVAEHEGVVEDISLRATVIHTLDGDRVYVPNRTVLGNPIINHTVRGARRTELTIGVRYDEALDRALEVVRTAAQNARGVDATPPVEAFVTEFGASSIDITVRFWHGPAEADRWRARSAVALEVKAAFDEGEIEIPFPQRTLHLESAAAPIRVASGE